MRNLLIVFVTIIVISNVLQTSYAKRIKRNAVGILNHTKLSEDFVMLKTRNTKDLEHKESITKKDNQSLYDAVLTASATTSANDHKSKRYHYNDEQKSYEIQSIPKQTGAANPLIYDIKNRNQKLKENQKDEPKISTKLSGDNAKFLKKDLQNGGNKNKHKSEINKALPSIGQETANIVGAHVIPPRYLMSSHAFYPFAPIDQMMRFANALFYKVGMDDDNEEKANNPIEFYSLDSPEPHVLFGSPTSALAQISSSNHGQKESLSLSKPSISSKTLSDRQPADLMNLFENIFHNPENHQVIHDEIEIFCPLHNGKVYKAHGNGLNPQFDDVKNGEVCSCHLFKKDKGGSLK